MKIDLRTLLQLRRAERDHLYGRRDDWCPRCGRPVSHDVDAVRWRGGYYHAGCAPGRSGFGQRPAA
jgi:hypothetical protein